MKLKEMMRRIRHILHVIKCWMLYDNKLTPEIYKVLCKWNVLSPYMVFYMDGGICSQMHQYLLGRYYADKGMRVAYDLGWFKRNGKDNNGVFDRKFEFDKMWPELPFQIASEEMITFYARVFPVKRNGMQYPPPYTRSHSAKVFSWLLLF